MSLGISPSHTSPLVSRARPAPPGKTKRNSYFGSRASTDAVQAVCENVVDERGEGVMGGLREKSEDELRRASREALEEALREEWEVRDTLMGKLESLREGRNELEKEREELIKAMAMLQARTEEAFNEQGRLEADLEERDELLDRVRGRMVEAERAAREQQRRHAEQERSFEAEREAFRAQEAHLLQRLNALSSPREPSAEAIVSHDEHAALQDDLASIQASHSTLLAKLNTLSTELVELKTRNAELEEENTGWEFLMRERTMSGQVREGGLFGESILVNPSPDSPTMELSERRRGGRKSELEALDEELEKEMVELYSDLEAQSPILDEQDFATDLDAEDRRDGGGARMLVPPSRRTRATGKRKGENLGNLPVTGSGLDLAAELGRAEVDLEGRDMRVLGKGDEGEALRAEVKQLREANKALSLYCSKIIDRIIAQEGFEHILSVDYKTRRMGNRSASGSTGNQRPSLSNVTDAMKSEVATPAATSVSETAARPLGVVARAFSSGPQASEGKAEKVETPQEETKTEKRVRSSSMKVADRKARRGFSLDLRSFGFGGGTTPQTPKTEQPPNRLKPLTLANRSSTVLSKNPEVPAPQSTPAQPPARKLNPEEEDEYDRRERHHMEATLKLMGIDRTTPTEEPSVTSVNSPYAPSSSYWTRKLVKPKSKPSTPRSRDSESSTSSMMERRGSTPLTRLSSALGSYESPLSPSAELVDPSKPISDAFATEALRAFDQREAEQAKALAAGKAQTGYTSPGPRRASLGSHRKASGGNSVERAKKVVKSESVSTLWSIGSGKSSRPPSAEFVPEHNY